MAKPADTCSDLSHVPHAQLPTTTLHLHMTSGGGSRPAQQGLPRAVDGSRRLVGLLL